MKKAISLLLLSLCLSVLHARDINFSQISSKNGLSQNTVRAIAAHPIIIGGMHKS
mgnify:CR=1 FL=1